MFGWSPQRAEIENKQFDLKTVNTAISQLGKAEDKADRLKNEFSNLSSQIQSTYRVSGGSGENHMVTKIDDVTRSAMTKLQAAHSELQDEIRTLQGQEEAYFENQKRLQELAAKEYEESTTRSNMFWL